MPVRAKIERFRNGGKICLLGTEEATRNSMGMNKPDVEYAVMMTILNFHTEFMKWTCAHVRVQMSPDEIDVTLTQQGPVPAEMRLARSEEGCALLRQVHEAMFVSCEEILRERIEPVVERKVREMVTTLDPLSGQSRIAIRF